MTVATNTASWTADFTTDNSSGTSACYRDGIPVVHYYSPDLLNATFSDPENIDDLSDQFGILFDESQVSDIISEVNKTRGKMGCSAREKIIVKIDTSSYLGYAVAWNLATFLDRVSIADFVFNVEENDAETWVEHETHAGVPFRLCLVRR